MEKLTIREEASRYLQARPFLRDLKAAAPYLDRQQVLTLRGQALNGDLDGAIKGLARLTGRAE